MRHARKLLTAAIIAIAALAITATAQGVEIVDEETGEHCTPVVLEAGHVVHGGCHVEFETTEAMALVVQTAGGPVTVMNCEMHIEAQIDETAKAGSPKQHSLTKTHQPTPDARAHHVTKQPAR